MPKPLEVITQEVLQLPRAEQVSLAHYLLSLEEEPVNPEVEAAWEEEIAARLQAVREGRVETISYEKVKEEIIRTVGTTEAQKRLAPK